MRIVCESRSTAAVVTIVRGLYNNTQFTAVRLYGHAYGIRKYDKIRGAYKDDQLWIFPRAKFNKSHRPLFSLSSSAAMKSKRTGVRGLQYRVLYYRMYFPPRLS